MYLLPLAGRHSCKIHLLIAGMRVVHPPHPLLLPQAVCGILENG